MPAIPLVCLLEGGTFMKCNKAYRIILGVLFIIMFIVFLLSYEQRTYKKIILFDYSYGNQSALSKEFSKLGFKYKKNFSECLERKILSKNVLIQNFSYQNRDCIILFCNSKRIEKKVKRILNKQTEMQQVDVFLPDDFYCIDKTSVLMWEFVNKKIYLYSCNNQNKIYIELIKKNEIP